jgi:hypothetical protein
MPRLGLLAPLFSALSACSYVVTLPYSMTDTPVAIAVVDQRPQSDKVDTNPREPLGFAGGVVGDEHFSPDRIAILRNRLSFQVGRKLEGKTVVLMQLRSLNINTRPTNLDAIISGARPVSPEDFGAPGGEQYRYLIVCDVAIQIDGRRIQARGTQGYNGPTVNYAAHHLGALMKAIDQLIATI